MSEETQEHITLPDSISMGVDIVEISRMKKILERMAQIAYSINLVNGFDTEVEVFACAENC